MSLHEAVQLRKLVSRRWLSNSTQGSTPTIKRISEAYIVVLNNAIHKSAQMQNHLHWVSNSSCWNARKDVTKQADMAKQGV